MPRINREHPKFKELTAEANSPIPRVAYNMREVGAAIGVSWQTVYRMVRRGKIAVVHKGPRGFLISAKELDRFLEDNAVYSPHPRKGGFARRKPATQPAEAI
jgi:excisionase family DNA binding protein